MTFYVIDRGVISEKDLDAIPNKPLTEQKEIYEILATICNNAAVVLRNRWNRENNAQKSFCGMESLQISGEKDMWQRKAQEAQASLSALVESRFQRG